MKRLFIIIVILFFAIRLAAFSSQAIEYEYIPDDESGGVAKNETDKLFESLPKEIKDKLLPIEDEYAGDIAGKYSFGFFFAIFKEKLMSILPDYLNMLSVYVGALIIISISRHMQSSIGSLDNEPAMNICTSLVSALIIGNMQKTVLSGVNSLLSLLSSTMLLIVPIMEAIYISGGNFTLATVSSTGLSLMIAFTQSLFSKVLSPAVSISFLLSIISSVTGNRGIAFLLRTLRTIITTVIILIMTLMTFALTLQSTAAAAIDSFATRTIRFALGSYIPIVGGAVSETFSLVQGSISLIKSLSGITGIVILILICAGPLISLVISRFSVYVASNLAGILSCDSEQALYSEIGSSYTLLISIVLSSSLMYILALAQFCKTAISM